MLSHELLKYLGVFATTWMSGDVGVELERLPTDVVISAVDDAKYSFPEAERVSLYRMLAHDGRKEVYLRLKSSLIDSDKLTELRLLSEDEDPNVQQVTADALRSRLDRSKPDEQTRVATLFALSLRAGPRMTLARALDGNVPHETDYLYVLANDANVRIRTIALESSRRMLTRETLSKNTPEVQEGLRELFETRLHDPVEAVRKLARRGYHSSFTEFV